jgi:DNA-binding response OmpR family regulator
MALPKPSDQVASPLPHLLVVEDEDDIVSLIERYFRNNGFRVTAARDGLAMREVLARQTIDVVLLDLGLPNEDGLELCRYLRSHWHGAIVMVTGRGDSVDRVVGLELGADDYVTKPFELRELLARVRSVLRRVRAPAPAAASQPGASIEFSGFVLDLRRRALADPAGTEVALTTGEFDLLKVLVEHADRVLTRDQIMGYLHGRDAGPFDRAIDVQVGRLRRKLEADPSRPQLIKAVRGSGYIFASPVRCR